MTARRLAMIPVAAGALAAGLLLWRAGPPPDAAAASPVLAGGGPAQAAAAGQGVGRYYADLESQLRRRPGDGRALVLKARIDMEAGRFEAAVAAYGKALDVAPKVARDAGVWAEYAEASGMAQGGKLQGVALQRLQRALALDSKQPLALDMAGSAAWEANDFARAAAYWKQLLAQLPSGEPRRDALVRAIETAERRARFALPAVKTGGVGGGGGSAAARPGDLS